MGRPSKLSSYKAGDKFYDWVLIENTGERSKFRCVCGVEKTVIFYNILKGDSKGCGCNGRKSTNASNTSHGICKLDKRFYSIHRNMVSRCRNIKNKRYKDYGALGIDVDNSWLSVENFYNEMYSSYLEAMELTEGRASLDRIDNNLGYSFDNCRWVDSRHQVFHRNFKNRNKDVPIGVRYEKDRNRYVVYWYEYGQNKMKTKVFNIKKYGDKALEKASEYRLEMIKLQISKGAPYVLEDFSD